MPLNQAPPHHIKKGFTMQGYHFVAAGDQDYELPTNFAGDLEDLHEAADAYNQDRLERGLIPMSMVEIMEAKKLP